MLCRMSSIPLWIIDPTSYSLEHRTVPALLLWKQSPGSPRSADSQLKNSDRHILSDNNDFARCYYFLNRFSIGTIHRDRLLAHGTSSKNWNDFLAITIVGNTKRKLITFSHFESTKTVWVNSSCIFFMRWLSNNGWAIMLRQKFVKSAIVCYARRSCQIMFLDTGNCSQPFKAHQIPIQKPIPETVLLEISKGNHSDTPLRV
jgi:hypothetical protein